MNASRGGLTALGARVHMFVRPEARKGFTSLFRDVLDCDIVERDFGMSYPILLVTFPDGSAFSVEFTDLAPDGGGSAVDDASARRGAWIEFRTTDLARYQQRLRDAGIPEFRHGGSDHSYFVAPGGQVFRLLDLKYVGP